MTFGVLGENARLLAVLQPDAATIDSHGNPVAADYTTAWTGAAPCHLREVAVIDSTHSQNRGGSTESTITAQREVSLIVRLSQAHDAAGLVLAGWRENATRVRVSDERVTPVERVFVVASSTIRAGGGALVDSLRLSLGVES